MIKIERRIKFLILNQIPDSNKRIGILYKAYSFIQIMILILKSRFRDIGMICFDIKMFNQKMVCLLCEYLIHIFILQVVFVQKRLQQQKGKNGEPQEVMMPLLTESLLFQDKNADLNFIRQRQQLLKSKLCNYAENII